MLDQQMIWLVIALVVLWTLPWKGIALWKSARNNDLPWFVALMVVNTVGLLEIIYIFLIAPRKEKDPQQ